VRYDIGGKGLKEEKFKITFLDSSVLGYYATYYGNFLPMFRDNLSVTSSMRPIRLTRNVGDELFL
jgi:hypothetical protein